MRVRIEQTTRSIAQAPKITVPTGIRRWLPPKIPETTYKMEKVVEVYIDFSEEEKQIIKTNNLRSLALDTYTLDPEFIRKQLDDEHRFYDRNAAVFDKYARDAAIEKATKSLNAPRIITLKDYLVHTPYYTIVETDREAEVFIERLKSEILPKIKAALETKPQPKSESFEL